MELDGVVLAEIVLVGTAIVIGVTNCDERLEINDVFSVRGDGVTHFDVCVFQRRTVES